MAPGPMNRGKTGVLHVHSTYSRDGRDPPEKLREFALARGIGFVGLTDHAEDLSPDRFERLADHCRAVSDDRVLILPGLEYRFAGHDGLHLLAIGLRRWIAPATPAEFAREVPAAAGFTIMAHPVLHRYRIPDEVAAAIDAIEVWNAAYNTRYLPDPRALRLLGRVRRRRPEVVGIAGLDQHDSRNDRETRVVLFDPDAPDPLAELRAGRFYNRGQTMRFSSRGAFGPLALAGLTVLRGCLDAANAAHERLSPLLAARAGRRGGAEPSP